jgi:hypothetical protein
MMGLCILKFGIGKFSSRDFIGERLLYFDKPGRQVFRGRVGEITDSAGSILFTVTDVEMSSFDGNTVIPEGLEWKTAPDITVSGNEFSAVSPREENGSYVMEVRFEATMQH